MAERADNTECHIHLCISIIIIFYFNDYYFFNIIY